MTKREKKLLNAKIRIAIREGDLPYVFESDNINDESYRQLVYMVGREMGKRFRCRKHGYVWTITE